MPQALSLETASLPILVDTISTQAAALNSYLSSTGKPFPSFKNDIGTDFLPPLSRNNDEESAKAHAAHAQLLEASRTLTDLLTPPLHRLATHAMTPQHDAFALSVLEEYDVPAHVPLTDGIAYADLAAKCGLDEGILRRVARYAMTNRFLVERDGQVVHSATSRLVATDADTRHFWGHMMRNGLPADCGGLEALRRYGPDGGPSRSGFAVFHGGKPIWDVLREDKVRAAHFNGAMRFAGAATAKGLEMGTEGGFDWGSLREGALVVDCGGGVGHISRKLGEEHPGLKFVVQDLPEVVDAVGDREVLGGRVTFEKHSFFEAQPQTAADVFLFRRIFHDWPDHDARKIIGALVPAMKCGARIVVWDQVVPAPGTVGTAEEKLARAADMQMMLIMGARERSLDEWIQLFGDAAGDELRLESHAGMMLCFVKA